MSLGDVRKQLAQLREALAKLVEVPDSATSVTHVDASAVVDTPGVSASNLANASSQSEQESL